MQVTVLRDLQVTNLLVSYGVSDPLIIGEILNVNLAKCKLKFVPERTVKIKIIQRNGIWLAVKNKNMFRQSCYSIIGGSVESQKSRRIMFINKSTFVMFINKSTFSTCVMPGCYMQQLHM